MAFNRLKVGLTYWPDLFVRAKLPVLYEGTNWGSCSLSSLARILLAPSAPQSLTMTLCILSVSVLRKALWSGADIGHSETTKSIAGLFASENTVRWTLEPCSLLTFIKVDGYCARQLAKVFFAQVATAASIWLFWSVAAFVRVGLKTGQLRLDFESWERSPDVCLISMKRWIVAAMKVYLHYDCFWLESSQDCLEIAADALNDSTLSVWLSSGLVWWAFCT